MEIPDLSTEKVLSTAADWLPIYLEDAGRVRTSISERKKSNREEALWALIPYDVQQEIERLALPTSVFLRAATSASTTARAQKPLF